MNVPLISPRSDDGGLVLIGILVVFVVIWIYAQLVERPQQIREKKRWIFKERKHFFNPQDWVSEIVDGLGNQLPPCQKCNSNRLSALGKVQIEEITIRYKLQKFKHNLKLKIKDDDLELGANQIFNLYIGLVQFTFQQKPTELGDYLNGFLSVGF